MEQFTLTLFDRDDSRFELRIQDAEQKTVVVSPPIDKNEIEILTKLAAENYHVAAPDLVQRGKALFDWVDQHSNRWFRAERARRRPMALTIDVRDTGLRHLPWELLHDGQAFLCADPHHWFTPLRRVTDPDIGQEWQPQKRQLGVLFMASSPENVQPVLDFEAEEASILRDTAHKPLDLQVEESGSLQGLGERLLEYEEDPDVIHLSGHADVDEREGRPLFLLEDEMGDCAPATPEELARTLRDANSHPRILFLSGCRTGGSDAQRQILSFSEQMVDAGIPVVLGWALPVGDEAASQAAAAFYDKLATGYGIAEAVALARQQLLESDSPYWSLLRCYVDGSRLNPLVAKGRLHIRRHNTQQQFLDAGGLIPVCARTDFVGRRRLLQRALRSLKAYYGEHAYAEGVLLHGMGGLGKSSAAARLVDRLKNRHEPIVCYGGLDETVLITALERALPEARSLLHDAEKTLAQRLHKLFEPENNPHCDKPLLLVFDDFEQNIPPEKRRQAKADYNPNSLRVLHTVLQAIHDSQSDSRVIVTSRFDIPVPAPLRLHRENPQTLRDADLKKKLAQLTALAPDAETDAQTARLRQRAIELAAGNPRLLEWLDKVLQKQGALPIDQLLDQLEREEAQFREEILAEALVEAQPSAVRHSLACAALYHRPVPLDAIEALTGHPDTARHLQQAASVGLVEISPDPHGKRYYVSSLLEQALADELDEKARVRLSAKGAEYLLERLEGERSEALEREIVRLAIEGEAPSIAREVGDPLAFRLFDSYRYHEAQALCRQILSLGDDFRILTTLARAEQSLGLGDDAKEHIERAVQLLPANRDELPKAVLKETAFTSGAYADILQARGQLDEALKIRQTEQQPVYEKLGDVRELLVARTNLAILLWQMNATENAARVRELLCLALADARRLRIPEAGQIEDILAGFGLSCEEADEAGFRLLADGEDLYPESGAKETLTPVSIDYFTGNKRITLWSSVELGAIPSELDPERFLAMLLGSVSIDAADKAQILDRIGEGELEDSQISELAEILMEEARKFAEMPENQKPMVDALQDQKLLEWVAWEQAHSSTDR